MVRTIISAQHTVVKDALHSPVIVLAWGQLKQQLLIPIESKGSRIIRIQGEHYTLLSLPATSPAWGFERCFRRSGDVTQTPDVVAPNGLSGRGITAGLASERFSITAKFLRVNWDRLNASSSAQEAQLHIFDAAGRHCSFVL
jgi:hypothetical protein